MPAHGWPPRLIEARGLMMARECVRKPGNLRSPVLNGSTRATPSPRGAAGS